MCKCSTIEMDFCRIVARFCSLKQLVYAVVLGTTGSDTIKCAGVWMDYSEALPFSQFLGN